MKKALLLIVLAGFAGLAAVCFYPGDWAAGYVEPKPRLDPEYLAYLERVKLQELVFLVPASEDAAAWGRSRHVFKEFSGELGGSRKLRTSTANTLELAHHKYEALYYDATYLYKITRTPGGDTTRFEVSYSLPREGTQAGVMGIVPWMKLRARIISYYIVSGRVYREALDDDRLR
jgi:hypothetical protein